MSKPDGVTVEVWNQTALTVEKIFEGCGIFHSDLQAYIALAVTDANREGEDSGREAMRKANLIVQEKNREANHQLGKAIQAKAEAEKRERLAAMDKDKWKARALEAEAKLHSLVG